MVSEATRRGRVVRKIGDIDALPTEELNFLLDAANTLIAELVVSNRQREILEELLKSKGTQAHRDQVFADAETVATKIEAGANLIMSVDRQHAALACMLNRDALKTCLDMNFRAA